MGMSASQMRYLSLTARKSDLEYQSQMINQERLNLANRSSDINKAYTEGMANQVIRIANGYQEKTGLKNWIELTYNNAQEQGYQIIGGGGEILVPSPYTEYQQGATLTAAQYNTLNDSEKAKCTDNGNNTYTVDTYIRGSVKDDYKGIDIQSLLVSGRGQIVSNEFFQFLCAHGYGSGKYYTEENVNGTITKKEASYEDMMELFQNQYYGTKTVIDWRADESNIFKQSYYTEDDAQVLANFEAQTAEIQQQDKMLELQLKRIETEHKAIETEMESVKKVLEKNIENSYKTFG